MREGSRGPRSHVNSIFYAPKKSETIRGYCNPEPGWIVFTSPRWFYDSNDLHDCEAPKYLNPLAIIWAQ